MILLVPRIIHPTTSRDNSEIRLRCPEKPDAITVGRSLAKNGVMKSQNSPQAKIDDTPTGILKSGSGVWPASRRKLIIFAGSAVVLLPTLILTLGPVLSGIGNYLVVNEATLHPANLIHPLGGSLERVDYAVELYRLGYGPRIFLTGCSCQENYAQTLAAGVNPDDVIRGRDWSTNTYQEATELKSYLDNHAAINSVIIVSSPYHMRRAQWIFRKTLGNNVRLQFAAVPFEQSQYRQQWWTDVSSAKMVLSEYLKNVIYHLRY